MREALLGLTLGWAAGISPGPMLGLVITTTIRAGLGAGLRMSTVPLLSDLPVVVVALAFAAGVPIGLLDWLSLIGGGYLIWLGASEMRAMQREAPPVSMGKAVMVNLMSPHPWLFWITVGAPILVEAWRRQPSAGVAFVSLFYLMIVSTKMAVAWVVARAGRRLSPAGLRRLGLFGGAAIAILGVVLILETLVA